MNPLLAPFRTPFESIPFDKIKAADFLPALKAAISEAKGEIEKLKNNTQRTDFHNTVEKLEHASEHVGLISNIFFALHSAESDEALRAVAKDLSPLLTEFSNDIILDPVLFEKIHACYSQKESYNLGQEQQKLLEEYHQDFLRNGARLSPEKKERLREIDIELSKLSLVFGDNVLKETQKHILEIDRKEDLKGLPDFAVEMAAEEARKRGKAGKYVFTLDFPSYSPFMKYAENRDLRKKFFLMYSSRAFSGGENDNQKVVLKIVALRKERAELLGYKSHADYVLERRMAHSPDNVRKFLNELLAAAKPHALREMEELSLFSKELGNGSGKLERWDYAYYAEKLKMKKFQIDDEVFRPYFPLDNVIQGIFQVALKLYDLKFTPVDNVPVYHPEVKVYQVEDVVQKKHIGLFYADFFPRPGKKNGAWMTHLKDQKRMNGQDIRPHVAIVCNFTRPTPNAPSLLTFDEVSTFFHEFGHALHGLLSECDYARLSGTNVFWDFVELPSQIMENWVNEKECLDLFASHYQTQAKIPENLIQKIKESTQFHEGYSTLRQLSFAFLDLDWHTTDPSRIQGVDEFERKAIEASSLLPLPEGVNFSCSFSHIFSGGYSAGYYSYKWAEVLDADAFRLFKEKGIFNQEVSRKFRQYILSKGGTQHPMELYKKFRGQEPSLEALLKRAGLFA